MSANVHWARWSEEELDYLVRTYDHKLETMQKIAAHLGRTARACEQRFYEYQHGRTYTAVSDTPGAWSGDAGRKPSPPYLRADETLCPDCHLVLPASGICCDD